MAKIVKVTGTEVTIAHNEEYIKLNPSELSFVPQLGDEVEVHKVDEEIIVMKKDNKEDDKINISIVNENNAVQSQSQVVHTQTTSVGLHYVNKWVYVLLAIFFGGFGAHHFYAGYNGKGILYLVLLMTGISVILGFLQGVLALFKTPDANGKIAV
jgi:TM2 domain family protein